MDLAAMRVVITADISDMEKKMNQGVQATTDFSKKAGGAMTDLGSKVEQTSRKMDTFKRGANEAARSLTGFAGPAALVTAGILLVANALKEYFFRESEASKATKALTEDTKKFNTELEHTTAKGQAAGMKLQALVDVAKDGENTFQVRNEALREANKLLGDHGEKLTLANINTVAATKAVEAYTQALIGQALAGKFADRTADLIVQQKDAAKKYGEAKKAYEDVKSVATGNRGEQFLLQTAYNNLVDSAKYYKAVTAELKSTYSSLNDAQKQVVLNSISEDKRGRLAKIDDEIAALEKEKKLRSNNIEDVKRYNAQIKKLQDERNTIDPKEVKVKATKTGRGKKADSPFEIDLDNLEDNYNHALALARGADILVLDVEEEFLNKRIALHKKYNQDWGKLADELALLQVKKAKELADFQAGQFIPMLPTATTGELDTTSGVQAGQAAYNLYRTLNPEIVKAIANQQKFAEEAEFVAGAVTNLLSPAFDALFDSLIEGSGNAFEAFAQSLNQTLKNLEKVILKALVLGAIQSLITGTPFNLSGILRGAVSRGFASGGFIQGPGTSTSDSIPARLSKGEYVINAASVQKFGKTFFDRLNGGSFPILGNVNFPKFNMGGFVSPALASNHNVNTNLAGIGGGQQTQVFIPELRMNSHEFVINFRKAEKTMGHNS